MILLIFNSLKKHKYLKKEIIHVLFLVIIVESPTSNEIQPQNSFICIAGVPHLQAGFVMVD